MIYCDSDDLNNLTILRLYIYIYIYFQIKQSCFYVAKVEVSFLSLLDDVGKSGEIVLGGLFPIHVKSQASELECGEQLRLTSYQVAQAMLYAVDQVNKNDNLLPNITIKAKIADTCRSQTIAASRTKEFIKMTLLPETDTQLAGIVGATVSDVSAKVASILQVFDIPQISHGSTSVLLSDKDIYSYFLRTVPPDSFQAQAMVDLCLRFGWTYVITINSEGTMT